MYGLKGRTLHKNQRFRSLIDAHLEKVEQTAHLPWQMGYFTAGLPSKQARLPHRVLPGWQLRFHLLAGERPRANEDEIKLKEAQIITAL